MALRRSLASSLQVLVSFHQVEKTYDGETNVVQHLDLDIHAGEFLTLLGPSGSGKTTTLMMLAGFETPTGGEITFKGKSLSNTPPYERNMGIVFQNYALFPHMTVEENLAFPLIQRKIPKPVIHEKVNKALNRVELSGLGRRRPAQLSGGQQQRVALARALVFEPELVLMDEPLGALDRKLREQMQMEIKHIHDALGMTVVYVTHDQGEALTLSNRVAIFNDGMIQQIDSPANVYEYPLNTFVANFIGDNNRFHGTVVKDDKPFCAVKLDNGERVLANPINLRGEGERTTLSIRPERVVISPNGDSLPNRFQARVLELIYHGDHTRVRMELGGEKNFFAKIPQTRGARSLQPGDAITVGWEPEHCRALDPDPT